MPELFEILSPEQQATNVYLQSLIALQTEARKIDFKQTRRLATIQAGQRASMFKGRGMAFDEVRMYQPGDDIRSMDWRVTARTGKPHTKLYQQERERAVFFVVDARSPMFFATKGAFKYVQAARATALLAWAGAQQGDKIGGILFNEQQLFELKPKLRKEGVLSILRTLADRQEIGNVDPKYNLAGVLSKLRRVVKPGALIFIFSDCQDMDAEAIRHLSRLTKHAQIFTYALYDPVEADLPPPARYGFTNGEEMIAVDSGAHTVRQTYQQQFKSFQEQLLDKMTAYQVSCDFVATNDDITQRLTQQFMSRGEAR